MKIVISYIFWQKNINVEKNFFPWFQGEVIVEICVYELNKSRICRTCVTSIPLQSQICCHKFSPDNEKLMIGCIDSSIMLFDEGRGITHLIKAAFVSVNPYSNMILQLEFQKILSSHLNSFTNLHSFLLPFKRCSLFEGN